MESTHDTAWKQGCKNNTTQRVRRYRNSSASTIAQTVLNQTVRCADLRRALESHDAQTDGHWLEDGRVLPFDRRRDRDLNPAHEMQRERKEQTGSGVKRGLVVRTKRKAKQRASAAKASTKLKSMTPDNAHIEVSAGRVGNEREGDSGADGPTVRLKLGRKHRLSGRRSGNNHATKHNCLMNEQREAGQSQQ